jgi:hypothetical protein
METLSNKSLNTFTKLTIGATIGAISFSSIFTFVNYVNILDSLMPDGLWILFSLLLQQLLIFGTFALILLALIFGIISTYKTHKQGKKEGLVVLVLSIISFLITLQIFVFFKG